MPASSLSRRSVEVEAWGAGGGRAKSRSPRRKRRSADDPPASLQGGCLYREKVLVTVSNVKVVGTVQGRTVTVHE